PYDEGPRWTPGEHYTRPGGGFSFEVLDSVPDGYLVRVRSGWQLEVSVVGDGRVTGLPEGPCATECTSLVAAAAGPLQLHAVGTDPEEPFRGWLGHCSGKGP